MADHDDAAGLFGFDDPAETIGDKGKGKGKGKPVAPTLRRVMLKNWDSVASQVLNPYGVSHIEKLSLKRIWDAAAKGNKACHFHTELAAGADTGGPFRVGIGWSRMAETILAGIAKLREPHMAGLIKDVHYKKAIDEANLLEPHLKILHAGKEGTGNDNAGPDAGFAATRKRARTSASTEPIYTQAQCNAAAEAVRARLSEPKTALRSMLHLLSGGGSFYAANVQEKLARSYIQHGSPNGVTCADVKEAVWARISTVPVGRGRCNG